MARLRTPISMRDHVMGRVDAPIKIVEYGDYQCPYCAAAQPRVRRLLARLGDSACFAFRNFPLTQVHEHALLGALAAEAAGRQDAFWPMHEMIFAHQDSLSPRGVIGFAQTLGLDLTRFHVDLDDDALEEKVRDDFASGVRSGVNGTPTFFINDQRYDGVLDADKLAIELGGV